MSDGPERWQRLEDLVQGALERPAAERLDFLAEACGGDEELRREAASLVARDARAEGFLATPLGEIAANAMTHSPGGPPQSDESRNLIGSRIGAYEIRARLGAGGMGEVYRAHDHSLHRDVAIKVLPAAFSADGERLARFEREARLLASLSHPHIGAIYGLQGSGHLRALVLELIDGETLESRLQRGPLPDAQALTLAVQIAEALDHAHRRGVTHRDLKPANVMLARTGAKLLDFGLAKWSQKPSGYAGFSVGVASKQPSGVHSLTREGTILGTLHYMAPEQLEGKDADARADVFAFGAVLYEMLTGRKAFVGGSAAAVIAAVLNTEPPTLGTIQSPAPRSLDRVIRKCLAKDPDQRWQTARDLADELKWIAEETARPGTRSADQVGGPIRTEAERALQIAQSHERRRYRSIIAAVGALSLVASAYGVFIWSQTSNQRAMAQEIFYSLKALQVETARTEQALLASGSTNTEALARTKSRRRNLEERYDRFLTETGFFNRGMAEDEKLIYRVARIFGESELGMPQVFVDGVRASIEKWRSTDRFQMAVNAAVGLGYHRQVVAAMLAEDLPPQFFYLAMMESDFNTYAVGPATKFGRAKGAWQFTPSTATEFGLKLGPQLETGLPDPADERHDFAKATTAAAKYLKFIFTTDAHASGLLVIASYNLGESHVTPLVRTLPDNPRDRNFWQLLTKYRARVPDETYDYVLSIVAAAVIGENPRLFGFAFENPLTQLDARGAQSR